MYVTLTVGAGTLMQAQAEVSLAAAYVAAHAGSDKDGEAETVTTRLARGWP